MEKHYIKIFMTNVGSLDSFVTSFGNLVSNSVIWNNWCGIVFLLSSWHSQFHINQIAPETIIMCWKAVDFKYFNAMSTVAFIKMHRKKIRINKWNTVSRPGTRGMLTIHPQKILARFLFTGNYLNWSKYSKTTCNVLTFVSLSCSAIVFYSIPQIECYAFFIYVSFHIKMW